MAATGSGKAHKSRLGRGLSSLLAEPVPVAPTPNPREPNGASEEPPPTPRGRAAPSDPLTATDAPRSGERVELVDLDQLSPSPFQPRRAFDPTGLAELAASIKAAGVMQPILARRGASGLEIIAGERRWRAARDAGLSQVPVLVRTLTDQETAEWSLVENLQREDLNPMDRSNALRRLAADFGLSHGSIAERVGLDRSSVTNLIRLGELEKEIRELLAVGKLSAGHGKALLAVAPGTGRVQLAKRAAKEGFSVRRLERMASSGGSPGKSAKRKGPAKTPAVQDMERQLRDHLGTEVSIETRGDGTRGTIAISFYDLDHFDRLLAELGVKGKS